ncbi:hypothetical protein INT46_008582, partial [Mucor plumbeus]
MLFVVNGKVLTTAQLTNSLSRYSTKFINANLTISMYRQLSVCFMWVWIKHFNTTLDNSIAQEEEGELLGFEDVRTLRDNQGLLYNKQAAHSQSIGSRFYGYSNLDFRYLSREHLQNFYLCSKEWALLLNLPNAASDIPSNLNSVKRINLGDNQNDYPVQINRFNNQVESQSVITVVHFAVENNIIVNAPNINTAFQEPISFALLQELCSFFKNTEAQFNCPEQASAINAVLNTKKDLLVVLPTGAVSNTKGPADTDSNADILFLAIEQCADLNLLAFIDSKYNANEINAIYIDEAHLIISWSKFRPKFNNLPSFRRYFAVPWILLSATVPEYLEQELSKMFGNLNVIRKSSNRPNLAYQCKFEDDIDEYVVEYVKKNSNSNRPAIVYVRYIDKVDEILLRLHQANVQAVGYHSKMKAEERKRSQQAFMDGNVFVIVATSGLVWESTRK